MPTSAVTPPSGDPKQLTAVFEKPMCVVFMPSLPSIVKSIRQRDLLNCWLRLARASNALPRHADFRPNRVDDELIDMMVFKVVRAAAYGLGTLLRADQPVYLDEAIGPTRYGNVIASYRACLQHRRPIYSVAMVKDQDGKDVAYERLLLPFGGGDEVDEIVGSYKTISIDGGFKIKDIMSLDAATPVTVVRAVIESFAAPVTPKSDEPCSEIVEI
jgi:hypothetical protein